ncbi:hypothetical protein HanRHA438_Chr06g0258371 [Helianthus annuus]|nr:hypothetical protein HanRHA438_Chr06g0258371 [Helianthus annuus]
MQPVNRLFKNNISFNPGLEYPKLNGISPVKLLLAKLMTEAGELGKLCGI